MAVRLDCPLCRATVADGVEPHPGTCPGCGARVEGGAETSQGAVEALIVAADLDGVDPAALTRALFGLDESSPLGRRMAITSDQRDGFYRWWVFIRTGDDDIGTLLRRVPETG